MNDLSNSIDAYYQNHFDALPLDKQVHFAARLSAWNDDERCKGLLARVKPVILPDDSIATSLQKIQSGSLIPLLPGNAHLLALRQAHNARYPMLRDYARLLYWAMLLESLYGGDGRAALSAEVDTEELATLYTALRDDTDAIALLSTHAINFLYLYTAWFCKGTGPEPGTIAEIGESGVYVESDMRQVQLKTYMYTHTIIADTLFYTRAVPAEHVAGHMNLLHLLNTILDAHSTQMSLDTKLEYLVCCRLLEYNSPFEASILREAEESLAPDGAYITDGKNSLDTSYASFEKSEHRSVLYLMATRPRNL